MLYVEIGLATDSHVTLLGIDGCRSFVTSRQREAVVIAMREEDVDEALNCGLPQMEARKKPREPFRTMSVDCGKPLIANIDNIAEVLAIIEGESNK